MGNDKRSLAALVLAAGEGKRFRSATPKVLHDLCGRPMLAAVLDAVTPMASKTVVVIGRAADAVQEAAERLTNRPLTFARQADQLGTADAARAGLDALGGFTGDVLIVPGDTPLLTAKTLRALVAKHRRTRAVLTLLTARLEDQTGYGRIVREGGRVTEIVEHRDATKQQRAIDEINAGVYVVKARALRDALGNVDRKNAQGELYLTDVVRVLHGSGGRIEALIAPDPVEIAGVNSRAQLAEVAAIIRRRTNQRLMDAGVTIVDPDRTYIDPTVKVGRDTIIHPLTFLHGRTTIGDHVQIGPNTRITDSTVRSGARVVFSEVIEATIGPEASVGPFAYLRPGATLRKGAKVGTFVEVKASEIGEGSKVPHLSYIGDAQIGKDVNVGAATVTVNYDGETRTKSKTVIGDGAKIGSDTMLVAPVKVGKNAATGAGAVVTKDVPPDTMVVGVPARKLRDRKGDDG